MKKNIDKSQKQTIIFDAHQDDLWDSSSARASQTNLDDLSEVCIKLVFAAAFCDGTKSDKAQYLEIKKQIETFVERVKRNNKLMIIKNKEDLQVLMDSQKTGLVLHIEGLDFISEDNLIYLDKLYSLGLRSIGLTWNNKNRLLSPAGAEGGLTELGKSVIDYSNKNNIIVDLAHANARSIKEAFSYAKLPPIVTHANAFKLCPIERNICDDNIKLIREKASIMGVFFSKKFVSKNTEVGREDLINQFAYIYSLAPDALMIGSDFGGITTGTIKGVESIFTLQEMLEELKVKLGEEAMQKIAYKNLLNYLKKNI